MWSKSRTSRRSVTTKSRQAYWTTYLCLNLSACLDCGWAAAYAQSNYRSNGIAPNQIHDQNQMNAAASKLGVDSRRLQSEQAEVEQQIGVLKNAEEQALNYKPFAVRRLSQLQQGHFSIGSPQAKEMYVLKNWLNRESTMKEDLDDQIADLNQHLIQLKLDQEDDRKDIKHAQQRLDEDSRSTAAFRNTLYNVNQNVYNNDYYNHYYYSGGNWHQRSAGTNTRSTAHTRMVPGYH